MRTPQKITPRQRRSNASGFTIVELAVTMTVVIALSAFAVTTFTGVTESTDASAVDAAQAALQSVVSQASARAQVNPQTLAGANVVNACRMQLPERAVLTSAGSGGYSLSIGNSGRGATFRVNTNGSVILTGLTGSFPHYQVVNGMIEKI